MTISTHVLDTSKGRPAGGIAVRLDQRVAEDSWKTIGRGTTDRDGRLRDFDAASLQPGIYRLVFDTGAYFQAQGVRGFYPHVTIAFELAADEHYHVPLLLNPFGYSTYRGS